MAKAMASLPSIHRRVIYNIAAMQALSTSGPEAKFWKGIVNGCQFK